MVWGSSIGRALAIVLLAVGVAASAAAQAPGDSVRFAVDVEKALGHLLVSQELYAAAQSRPAAVHAAHPVQELGNRLIGPVRRVDAVQAEHLRAALKRPGRAAEAHASPAAYAEAIAALTADLQAAVERVITADVRTSTAFRTAVIDGVLAGVAEEYAEGFKDGRITQPIEYGDAYGFFRRAQRLYAALPPAARRADAELAALAKAFPGVKPPPSPASAEAVSLATRRIRDALRAVRP